MDLLKKKKIDQIIFENKINKKFLTKEILQNLNNFNIIQLNKISFINHLNLIFKIIPNIFLILKVFKNLNKKSLLLQSNDWIFAQYLHGTWDLINLNKNRSLNAGFILKVKSILYGIFKLELSKKIICMNTKYAFLDHSVYANRWLLANLRNNNVKVYNQAVTNIHLQKKNKDISWSDVDSKIINQISKNKKKINTYWHKRINSKGNYLASNVSSNLHNKKEKKVLSRNGFNLVLLHVFKDSPFNVIDRNRIFVDYFDWIENTLKIIENSKELWVFKMHPISSRWGENQREILNIMLRQILKKKLNNLYILGNSNKNDLLLKAKKILTFSGTAALEAIVYKKKPIVICKTNIEKLSNNVVIRPKSLSEYKKILVSKIDFKCSKKQSDLAKTILYARENLYCMKTKIKNLEVYRKDNEITKNKSFKSVKKNLPFIYKFLLEQGERLAYGKTHTYIENNEK